MEMVNRPYAGAFETYAVANPDVLCLSADLTSSCEIDGFRDRHPDQFLSLGMAEQNMLSVAAGLAREGFIPWLHTFAVFHRALVKDLKEKFEHIRVRLLHFVEKNNAVRTPAYRFRQYPTTSVSNVSRWSALQA